LEGLEIKEIMLSECLQHKDLRFEADFWIQKTNTLTKTIKGSEIIDFVQYGTSKELIDEIEGYPILQMNEFNSRFIGVPSRYCKLISQNDFESLKLRKNDVLVCRTNGNPNLVGKCALVAEDVEYAYASYLFKIRPKNEFINSATLVAFLSCKYGRKEIDKYSMTSNQTNFSPAKFREIDVPLFSKQINNDVDKLYYTAFDKLKRSENIYRQAEELLLETIGLKDFRPSENGTNIKSFKDSFLSTGRLDAEYYQPKYEDYLRIIKTYSGGFDLLQTICSCKDDNFVPEETKDYQYIELSNIGKSGNITDCTLSKGSELPSRARRRVHVNDVIISSIEGSLEKCAIVTDDYDNALCSTGFYVINSCYINSETLLVLFKSEIMQHILKQNCSGTILTAINKMDFLQIPVPLINNEIQQQIAVFIEESFKLRKDSERLLEEARKMVEREVEK
jgi:restriction endonuclease S subunit